MLIDYNNMPKCPQCWFTLAEVTNSPNSMLNDYQFDAVRAGDFYCVRCKGNQARTGYRYWWSHEVYA